MTGTVRSRAHFGVQGTKDKFHVAYCKHMICVQAAVSEQSHNDVEARILSRKIAIERKRVKYTFTFTDSYTCVWH